MYPVFRALAMGWSWALWVMQCILTGLVLPVLPHGSDPLVPDRGLPPLVSRGAPLVSIYVDNLAVVGLDEAEVSQLMERVIDVLDLHQIHWHEHSPAAMPFKLVGHPTMLHARPI